MKRFSEYMNKFQSDITFLNMISYEIMSDFYVFGSRTGFFTIFITSFYHIA